MTRNILYIWKLLTSDLYPTQWNLLEALLKNENIIFTAATNSGKTIPAIIYPLVLQKLGKMGYPSFQNPKVLFVTALNSLQLSLLNNINKIGIECEAATKSNIERLMTSRISVVLISPEVLKIQSVTQILLKNRSKFVLKVVDEAHLDMYFVI